MISKRIKLSFSFFIIGFIAFSQASWSTSFAFRLFNDKGEIVDKETFKENYRIADVFGNIVDVDNERYSFLGYNKDSNYYTVSLTTIGHAFSFAIYKEDKIMTIHIPFAKSDTPQYAIARLKFKDGDYLMNFNCRKTKKVYLYGQREYLEVQKVNWRKQSKQFLKSEWHGREKTYRESVEK